MVGNNKGSFAYPKTMRNNMAEINLRELNALMKDPRAAILASEKELEINSRSKSAKLRVAVKV